ncbi:hypothetical protein FPHYL_7087 [Fusarium phyllophilum]|uniref:Uncharacterized protein n=1 Tax=Fusarium phyllophilum TaxID=47803 RepID=A0A8H5JQF4_9HYPO|nr:hypothetical protein FPHYL_7087 [Fusarium phyllophilum]
MSERVIIVEVAPSLNKHDEQYSLEEKIDLAESKIEGLLVEMSSLNQEMHKLYRKAKNLEKSNERFEEVLFKSQQKGASRRAMLSGLETLKEGVKTCLESKEQLLHMDLKSLKLQKELREWEFYREGLKTSQEEMRFDEWMRREESLPYQDWKKSTYSRE